MDFYNKVVIDKNYAIQFKSGLFYTFYTLLKNPFPGGLNIYPSYQTSFATLSPESLFINTRHLCLCSELCSEEITLAGPLSG